MTPNHRNYPGVPEEVYFYGTCLSDTFYSLAGLAAVELIEQQGVRVIFPPDQTCCGQPAFNSGYQDEAYQVAHSQLQLFQKPIPIVVPSGSCGAMMRCHYPALFAGQDGESEAIALSERVFEWSEFMAHVLQVKWMDRGPKVKVAYHPSCHLTREMGIGDTPLDLLRQLSNVDLRPLTRPEECCGFGGSFSIKQSHISAAMVEDKCADIVSSGAELVISADNGCLMNIGGALSKNNEAIAAKPLALFIKERIDGA